MRRITDIRKELGVKSVIELLENKLFGHLRRMGEGRQLKKMGYQTNRGKQKGQPKKKL